MTDTVSYASRMDDDTSLLSLWKAHRTEGIANCTPIWNEARRLKKFAAREQWPDQHGVNDPNKKSPRMVIPETSRVLAAFSGRQIMERVEREYIPRNQDAARFAETWTRIDRAVMQACNGEQVDSSAFRDGPGIQGVSWVRWYVDEWSGPKPRLKMETIPIWQMIWSRTREINLTDRSFQRWISPWPQATVKERWHDKYNQIKMLIGTKPWSGAEQSIGKSSRIPWTGGPGQKEAGQEGYYDPLSKCLWIEYEEYRELIVLFEVARPIDPNMSYEEAFEINRQRIDALEAGEASGMPIPDDPMERVEMTPDQLREFRKEHLAIHAEDVPNDMIVRRPRMVYRYIYGCGDIILEHGDCETGGFTFQAMAAEVIELAERTAYISLLSDLEDAQRMVNYMMSALIRDIQINPKGTLFIEQGLFRDKDQALSAFTAPGGVVEIPRGRMVGSAGNKPWDFIAGGTGQYSSKLESMLAFYREAIPRLAGFNPAALGQLGTDIRRVSGEVVRQLADATMTSNAERIDALRLYRREGGRIFLSFARVLWEPEDLIDFIGETDAYDEVIDPNTGLPQIDPATGEPQKVLAIPPKSMWTEESWREIAIEEVAPVDSAMAVFWDKLQTQVGLLQAPMPDTGQPLFTAEDWVDVLPGMPAARRAKMLTRVKAQARQFKMQQLQQQQMQAQGGEQPPVEGLPDQAMVQ